MAKTKSLKQNTQFQGFIVLLLGAILGVIGFYWYLQASASTAPATRTAEECELGGGEVSGDYVCVGGELDGVSIEAGELP